MLKKLTLVGLGTSFLLTGVGQVIQSCSMDSRENIFGATWCASPKDDASNTIAIASNALHCSGCYMMAFGAALAVVVFTKLILETLGSIKAPLIPNGAAPPLIGN